MVGARVAATEWAGGWVSRRHPEPHVQPPLAAVVGVPGPCREAVQEWVHHEPLRAAVRCGGSFRSSRARPSPPLPCPLTLNVGDFHPQRHCNRQGCATDEGHLRVRRRAHHFRRAARWQTVGYVVRVSGSGGATPRQALTVLAFRRRWLAGFVGSRDVDFESDPTQSVLDVMTPLRDLVVARDDTTLQGANKILRDSKKGCVQRSKHRLFCHTHAVACTVTRVADTPQGANRCTVLVEQEAAYRGRRRPPGGAHVSHRPAQGTRVPARGVRPQQAVAGGRRHRYAYPAPPPPAAHHPRVSPTLTTRGNNGHASQALASTTRSGSRRWWPTASTLSCWTHRRGRPCTSLT